MVESSWCVFFDDSKEAVSLHGAYSKDRGPLSVVSWVDDVPFRH